MQTLLTMKIQTLLTMKIAYHRDLLIPHYYEKKKKLLELKVKDK